MKTYTSLLVDTNRGVARVTLNRPERRNAFDGRMIQELRDAFEDLARDESLRAVILTGGGPVFCGGADLRWMSPGQSVSETQARSDAELLDAMYRAIEECPCPVIGRVQGPAYGGGVGLLAVCDVVLAAEDASFALSEVKLGLIPAVIAPWLLRRAGESFVRRYCLTGEAFSASVAKAAHLVHEVTEAGALDQRVTELTDAILRLAPGAVRETKSLLRRISELNDADRRKLCIETNVRARLSQEAREGLQAFFDKRPPSWVSSADHQHPTGTNETRHAARQRA